MKAVHVFGDINDIGVSALLVQQSFKEFEDVKGEGIQGNIYLTSNLKMPSRYHIRTYGQQYRTLFQLASEESVTQRKLYNMVHDVAFRVSVKVYFKSGRATDVELRYFGVIAAGDTVQYKELDQEHNAYVIIDQLFRKLYLRAFMGVEDSYTMCRSLQAASEGVI